MFTDAGNAWKLEGVYCQAGARPAYDELGTNSVSTVTTYLPILVAKQAKDMNKAALIELVDGYRRRAGG